MANLYSRLPLPVQLAVQLLRSYSPAQATVDAHLDSCLPPLRLQSAADATFLRQTVYGVTRYAGLLSAFRAAFYHHRGGSALRKDAGLYNVLVYLAVVRFEELGPRQFERIVRALDPQKAAVLLGFLFDERHLRGELRDEWLKIYDKAFVEERIGAAPRWTCAAGLFMHCTASSLDSVSAGRSCEIRQHAVRSVCVTRGCRGFAAAAAVMFVRACRHAAGR